jgi:signal recognition particle subunit SEC65
MNYNTNLKCTYQYYDPYISPDLPKSIKKEVEDLESMSEILYQAELLQVFYLSEYNYEKINEKINELYLKMEKNKELKEIMKNVASKILSEDETTGFMILFSYSFFYLLHECICDFLVHKTVAREKIEKLKKASQVIP